jgi:predicted Rossmann fold nucleotide-binding protein DprA/Smf involved in DNA uptake
LQQFLGDNAPESFTTSGNFELLSHSKLAIFSSNTCPKSLFPELELTIKRINDPERTIIGGFHSDAEKHCLNILLDCSQPVIIAPARSLDRMRVRAEYQEPLQNGRLLFAGFFKTHRHRSEIDLAIRRNRYVAALADRILIVHAPAESKTEQLCRELISWGKPVYTLESEANHNLFNLGVKPITAR